MNNYNIPGFTNTSNTNGFSLIGPLPENQMPTYGSGDNVFRYYNSDMGFEGSKIYTNDGYDPVYKDWLNNT
jgi:hypothetical protein